MHLDILVEQLDWSTKCVLDWGATALTEVLDPGPKAWRIFADPAGHPFCLVTAPEWRRTSLAAPSAVVPNVGRSHYPRPRLVPCVDEEPPPCCTPSWPS